MTAAINSNYCKKYARTFKPLARDLERNIDVNKKQVSEKERKKRLAVLAKFMAAIFEVYVRRDAASAVTVFLMSLDTKDDMFIFALSMTFNKESSCMEALVAECIERPGIKLRDQELNNKLLKFGSEIDALMKKPRKLTKLTEQAFKYKPRTVH